MSTDTIAKQLKQVRRCIGQLAASGLDMNPADVLAICAAAEQGAADTERLDWLDENVLWQTEVELSPFASESLRAAIDAAKGKK